MGAGSISNIAKNILIIDAKKLIKLFDKLQSKIYFNYNIGKLTWFRTGGNAKAFAIIENTQELEIIKRIKSRKIFCIRFRL